MPLSKSNVKTRLDAIAADPTTPVRIQQWLNRLLDQHERIGRDPVVVAGQVDSYLDTVPAALDEELLKRAVQWIILHWEDIP